MFSFTNSSAIKIANCKIILASTSPYRQEILKNAGIPFLAMAPTCDEDALKDPKLTAIQLTQKLARAKAESLKSQFPNDWIIGSDQVLEFENKIYGKPKIFDKALEQLKSLNGKTHNLVTSLAICGPNNYEFTHTNVTTLTMNALSEAELIQYLKIDNPLDCAGSYKIEKSGIQLFNKIETQDYHSIQGLPLLVLIQKLRECGFQISDSKNTTAHSLSQLKFEMLRRAQDVQKNSYSPYSTKKIASCILWNDGTLTAGCNIENASYGATVCAERVAIWSGLAQQNNRTIKAVLVLSDANPPWPPCGMCRQVISEFAEPNLVVLITNGTQWIEKQWQEIFPMGFEPQHLGNQKQ